MNDRPKPACINVRQAWNQLYNIEQDGVTPVPCWDPRHVRFDKEDPRYEKALSMYKQEEMRWKASVSAWEKTNQLADAFGPSTQL